MFPVSTHHKVGDCKMDQQEVHLAPHFNLDSVADELVERDRVEGEAEDEEDGISDDGDDLGLSKHHVVRRGEVGSGEHLAFNSR